MPLNIKDPETERLAREVAAMTGESKTGAVRQALRERRQRLVLSRGGLPDKSARIMAILERQIWPELPSGVRGHPMSREEEDAILGLGPEGA